jgi:PIN domain nuclease of toxin-antitoxin system
MFVSDTHSLVWYILKKAPPKVREIFQLAEKDVAKIHIPTIALAEIFYLIQKGRVKLNYDEMLSIIDANPNLIVVSFNYQILREFVKIKYFDLHDQIIVSTAKLLNATLITKDRKIRDSKIIETVWN